MLNDKCDAVISDVGFPDYVTLVKGAELILKGLGVDKKIELKEHVLNTPSRMAHAFIELCEGLFEEEPSMTLFNAKNYNQVVVVKDIKFTSLCAHHFLSFTGTCSVAYLPDKYVVGLSKIPRVVKFFASRPQIQEELVIQIADYLMEKVLPKGVAVMIEAVHTCMTLRGVKADSASFITSVMRGVFLESNSLKEEALMLLGLKR